MVLTTAVTNENTARSALDDPQLSAYVLRMSGREKAIEQNYIGIGWSKVKSIKGQDRQFIKNEIKKHYNYDDRALGNVAGSIDRFVNHMKVGDYVLIPLPHKFMIGKITSDSEYIQESGVLLESNLLPDDFCWRRKVDWLNKGNPISRENAQSSLQNRLKVRQTCVYADDLIELIKEVEKSQQKISLLEPLTKSVIKALEGDIYNFMNPAGFEKLISKLLSKNKLCEVRIPSKNEIKDGDVDIIATYNIDVGNQKDQINILYQVKFHQGTTDEHGIYQLIKAKQSYSKIDIHSMVLVTTAENVTDAARKIAEENEIKIICKDELLSWIAQICTEYIDV